MSTFPLTAGRWGSHRIKKHLLKSGQRTVHPAIYILGGKTILNEKDIVFVFPAVVERNSAALVLKNQKTKTSGRKVFLPRTVTEMLVERREQFNEYRTISAMSISITTLSSATRLVVR
jgi:hypothetical protein